MTIQYKPSVSLWANQYGDYQILITNKEVLEKTRQELIRLAESLEVGMNLSCSKNRPEYVKTPKHPTHRFSAYFPTTPAAINASSNDSI